MPHIPFNETRKMKKADFETMLIEDFGHQNITARKVREECKLLTLYYVAGVHSATWTGGVCWTFEKAYGEPK